MEQTSGSIEFDREDVTFKLNPDEVVTSGFNEEKAEKEDFESKQSNMFYGTHSL